jgi:polysaccharide deacetylase 2 family uncharacterized protein YibQ
LSDTSSSNLHKPLGAPTPPARKLLPGWLLAGIAILPFATIAGVLGYGLILADPRSGTPFAEARIETGPAPTAQSGTDPQAMPPAFSAEAARQGLREGTTDAAQLEADAGVKVVRPGSEAPGAVVIRVPDAATVRLNPAPDRRLVERGRHGVMPRVGDDGARAWQVYARPADAAARDAPVRIAILVGGLGISGQATAEAITRLPGEISLAFAPYGGELERQVQRARTDGHEVFVQTPMEPFDYPDNDPGPHTLLAGGKDDENIDRLRWVLSRFSGQVGIVNFMGARFAADEAALGPILREVAQRGLMVIDDGSSGRSLLTRVAAGFRTPALRADLVLDLTPRAEAIDRELARLEALARERGFAFASASALPVTIDRLARWSRGLDARGIRLIPVSAGAQTRAASTTGAIR